MGGGRNNRRVKKGVRKQKADMKGCSQLPCWAARAAAAVGWVGVTPPQGRGAGGIYPPTHSNHELVEGCSTDVESLTPWASSTQEGFGDQRESSSNTVYVLGVGSWATCPVVGRVVGYRQDSDSVCDVALSLWLCS